MVVLLYYIIYYYNRCAQPRIVVDVFCKHKKKIVTGFILPLPRPVVTATAAMCGDLYATRSPVPPCRYRLGGRVDPVIP